MNHEGAYYYDACRHYFLVLRSAKQLLETQAKPYIQRSVSGYFIKSLLLLWDA